MTSYFEVNLWATSNSTYKYPIPGDFYDKSNKTFHHNENAKSLKKETLHPVFNIDVWDNLDRLNQNQHLNCISSIKKYVDEQSEYGIVIRGTKIVKTKAQSTPSEFRCYVKSVDHKSFVDFLVLFSQKLSEKCIDDFKKFIEAIVYNNSSTFMPECSKYFEKAYIFQSTFEVGQKCYKLMHSAKEYGRILRDSTESIFPVTAWVFDPDATDVTDTCKMIDKKPKSLPEVHPQTMKSPCIDCDKLENTMLSGKGHGYHPRDGEIDNTNSIKSPGGRGFGTMKGRGLNYCPTKIYSIGNKVETTSKRKAENEYQHVYSDSGKILRCEDLKKTEAMKCNSVNIKETGELDEKAINLEQKGQESREIIQDGHSRNVEKNGSSTVYNLRNRNACTMENNFTSQTELNSTTSKHSSENLIKSNEKSSKKSISSVDENADKIKMEGPQHAGNVKELLLDDISVENVSLEDRDNVSELKIIRHVKGASDDYSQKEKRLKEVPEPELNSQDKIKPSSRDKMKGLKENPNASGRQNASEMLMKSLGIDDEENESILQGGINAKGMSESVKESPKKMRCKMIDPVEVLHDSCGIKRKYFGIVNKTVPEKVILFLGASGGGKTMLVNFIANYSMGKKSADDDLILVAEVSPSSSITAYTFCTAIEEIPITVIDTPGLNDSSGAEVKDHVDTLKKFIAQSTSRGLKIHAVGFVAQAYLVRLTSSERLVMNYVNTLFGRSIADHLFTLVTFADNQDSPPVIEAMENFGVKFKLFLKFNNSTLNSSISEEIEVLDRVFWKICCRSWKKCLKKLKEMEPLSVNTMRAIQSEVYSQTVIKSAENDFKGEIRAFFITCKNGNGMMSEDDVKLMENIWKMASIVNYLKSNQSSTSSAVNDVITEISIETCKVLNISADRFVPYLCLCPSRNLVASAVEIIKSMIPIYNKSIQWLGNTGLMSKSVSEFTYCQVCEAEHEMKRYEPNVFKKLLGTLGSDDSILALKCKICPHPGSLHGISSVMSPLHPKMILKYTSNSLKEVIATHSFKSFPVKELDLLMFIQKQYDFDHCKIIDELIKLIE